MPITNCRPLPSPTGRNAAGLFFPPGSGMAFDAAPERRRLPIIQVCRDLMERGVSDRDINAFIRACFEPDEPAEDEETEEYAGANLPPDTHMSKDGLGLPRHDGRGLPKNSLAADAARFLGVTLPKRGFP